MSPEQKYLSLYKEMAQLCDEQGWGDPFSYARSKEIYATCVLGHSMPGPNQYAGCDGINAAGQGVEYKSTTQKRIKGSYTGISVQPTWEEQVEYLQKEKILKYPEHYFNRFVGGDMVESWVLTGRQVYDTLLPKLKKKYPNVLSLKDPRLSADVSMTEIKNQGKQVI